MSCARRAGLDRPCLWLLPTLFLFFASALPGIGADAASSDGSLRPEVENGPAEATFFLDVPLFQPDDLARLAAAGFDIAGIDRRRMLAGVVVRGSELERLSRLGFTYSIRREGPVPLNAAKALSDYTDPQELSAFMDQVAANFPKLAQKVLLQGTLFEGQKVWALKITKDVGQANDRPTFLVDAQHHAREVMTPEIAKDMIDYLTSRYATDPDVQRWVDNINIWIVPSVNPDGAMYVFNNDNMWRKNRNPVCPADINRNYPFLWNSCGGSSASCSSETYHGPEPGSEPETKAMVQVTADAHALFALSYHSYGEYIMYSYGCNDPDQRGPMDAVAQKLNGMLQNDNGQTGQWSTGPTWSTIYTVDGGSNDTQYGMYGSYSYVIEVNSSDFQPDYATWRTVTVERQRTAWQFFLNQTLDGPVIRGQVTDQATSLPLPAEVGVQEVTFTHGEWPRRADARGFYHWLGQSGSTYNLTFSMDGYCSETRTATVEGGPVILDVELSRPPAPAALSAAGNGASRIDVSWSPVSEATEYHIFRSLNAGGPYSQVGVVPAPEALFIDSPISGGVTYYYTVRAFNRCESAASPEANASTTGPCTEPPQFGGLVSVIDAGTDTCTQTLAWTAGRGICAEPLTYRVYRGTTLPLTPSSANLIASGLIGTGFVDHDGMNSGTIYHYIVRAVDPENGQEDTNGVIRSSAPTGIPVLGDWNDDAGDSGAAKMSLDGPWAIQPSGGKTAPKVYATGGYSDNQCASITTPPITLAAEPKLAFASKYDLETNYDAGIVEIATGPDFSIWTRVTGINYPDPLTNSGNACGIPSSSLKTVFSHTYSTPAYSSIPYHGPLTGYDNKVVKLRWRFGSDGGTVGKGWWVDDIKVRNAMIPGVCTSGLPPAPKEVSPPSSPMTCAAGTGGAVDVVYTPGCGTLDNAAYWGLGPIAGSLQWTGSACALGNTGRASFNPGTPDPGKMIYFVLVGQNATKESSYGQSASGIERPDGSGVGTCHLPQDLTGACP